jgi:hypothetical protein
MLPDEVLLEIFNFYVDEDPERIDGWITLVHVCRRWRSVVYQSPRRLNLRLVCTHKTRARDTLDIWPFLPLVIRHVTFEDEPPVVDNIIAALEHNDRVCRIELNCLSNPQLRYVTDSEAMQKPFPKLTDLHLSMLVDGSDGLGPVLPDTFLGGTAPRLQSLILCGIPFPGLPKLLLSATQLVELDLLNIFPSGYIPPQTMATSLSALNNLKSLCFIFKHPRPRLATEIRHPPPLTRSILPSLTDLRFIGTSEYLEEILARVDAPRVNQLRIAYFNQIIFDTPQLFQFISRRPTLRAPEIGYIKISKGITVEFSSQTPDNIVLSVRIECTASEWQLSSLAQVCTSSLPPLSTLEDLAIIDDPEYPPRWQDDVENTLWLELLHPFVAVKDLWLRSESVPRIAPALQELVGGRTTEVLPALENIFLLGLQASEPVHEGIEKFAAARRLTSHPVEVWGRDCTVEMDGKVFQL